VATPLQVSYSLHPSSLIPSDRTLKTCGYRYPLFIVHISSFIVSSYLTTVTLSTIVPFTVRIAIQYAPAGRPDTFSSMRPEPSYV
jgi:hypothetical protein